MKKILTVLLTLSFVMDFIPQTVLAHPSVQAIVCAQYEVVQADDSVSTIADKFYGDVLLFPAIVEATNQMNASDNSYAKIDNPDVIEVGWKLCIPNATDAAQILRSMQCKSSPAVYLGLNSKRFAVSQQLVFLGKTQDLNNIVPNVIAGNTVSAIDFNDLPVLRADLPPGLIYEQNWTGVEIRLVQTNFDYTENTNLIDIYTQIYTSSLTLTAPVFVDFNYLTGRSLIPGSGDPNAVGGHPLGSPFTIPGPIEIGYFTEQWAFDQSPGIGAYKSGTVITTDRYFGNGSKVAIFDTSPYALTGRKQVPLEVGLPGKLTKMLVTVSCPWISDNQPPPEFLFDYQQAEIDIPQAGPNIPPGVASHGLFVSGLVYGVAPESDLQLIRVLDDNGVGDLFWLINSLVDYLDKSAKNADIGQTVINLSLGIQPGDAGLKPGEAVRVCELFKQANIPVVPPLPDDCNNIGDFDDFLNMDEVIPLRTLLFYANQKGALIVAAAGNDSARREEPSNPLNPYKTINPPVPDQIPASYSFVYSVKATNTRGIRSCFSNEGSRSWSAPGGDAISPSGSPDICDPTNLKLCELTGPNCDLGLTSVLLTDESNKEYSLAFWAGTSFSTPLVSGALANASEALVNANRTQKDVYNCLSPSNSQVLELNNLWATIRNCP